MHTRAPPATPRAARVLHSARPTCPTASYCAGRGGRRCAGRAVTLTGRRRSPSRRRGRATASSGRDLRSVPPVQCIWESIPRLSKSLKSRKLSRKAWGVSPVFPVVPVFPVIPRNPLSPGIR
eukprot:gene12969-biopygen14066